MKTNLAALEIHYLITELQSLVSAKVDKIYHPEKNELLIQLHIPNKGKTILRILIPSCMYITEYKPESEEPSNFCMFLRKHLSNSRLRSIRQLGFERIIELEFEKKEGKEKLIIELFSKGNIILCSEDYIILSALEAQTWKDRTIKPKEKYIYPKKDFNFLELQEKELQELLSTSTRDSIVKALAMDLGLGGVYAEEALILLNIDKNKKPGELKETQKLYLALSRLKSQKISPQLILNGSDIKDIVPFGLQFYKEFEKKQAASYNEALDSYYTNISLSVEKEKSKSNKQIEKVQTIIRQQKAQIGEMKAKEQKAREVGDAVYQHYAEIKGVLEEAKNIVNKSGWEAIKTHFKGNKSVKTINSKDKALTLELA